MKAKLGKQETQMLTYLQMRKRQTVKTGELTGPDSHETKTGKNQLALGGCIE